MILSHFQGEGEPVTAAAVPLGRASVEAMQQIPFLIIRAAAAAAKVVLARMPRDLFQAQEVSALYHPSQEALSIMAVEVAAVSTSKDQAERVDLEVAEPGLPASQVPERTERRIPAAGEVAVHITGAAEMAVREL